MKRLLLSLLGLGALTACTGNPVDESAPVRLIIQDGAALRVIDPGDPNNSIPLRESPPITLGTGATDERGNVDQVIGIATLAATNRLAVAFPTHVDLYQTTDNGNTDGLGLQPVAIPNNLDTTNTSRFPAPYRSVDTTTLSPCYKSMRPDDSRTLLVLLSACPGDTQRVVVLNTSSVDPGASWWRDLPAPYPQNVTDNLIAVSGGNPTVVTVTRPNVTQGGDVFRATRSDAAPLIGQANYTTVLIRDLTNYQGVIYAATDFTDGGVRPVGDTALGQPILTPRASRLFGDGQILTAWNDNTQTSAQQNQLYFARGTVNTVNRPQYAPAVTGAAAPPDGFVYVLSSGVIQRYDILVGLTQPNNVLNATPLYLPQPLGNPLNMVWAVPQ